VQYPRTDIQQTLCKQPTEQRTSEGTDFVQGPLYAAEGTYAARRPSSRRSPYTWQPGQRNSSPPPWAIFWIDAPQRKQARPFIAGPMAGS
jgi:hypothetical protein